MIDYKAEAEQLRGELVAYRRDFHRHPEVGFEVHRTAAVVAEQLQRLGLDVQTGVGKTGVVALLQGEKDGPTVLWRSDMDALPIHEDNDVPYASQIPGVMHACGHDGHMAIALGLAHIFAKHKQEIAGRIKFMFQPAEELGAGGALAMIADGVLENPEPQVTFGMHLWNTLPLGMVGLADGAIMSGGSFFNIRVRGLAGHAAMPHTTIDPVACTGQLISALHQIVGRRMDAMAGAVVLSVTSIQSNSHAYNAIPAYVDIGGTFRTFNAYTSEMLEQHVRSVAKSVCESVGCTAEVQIRHPTIPVVNDPDIVKRVHQAFLQIVDEESLVEERTMASEDMSYILEEIPGVYFFVGSSNAKKGLTYGHHHPRFDFDEDALPLAVALGASAIADYVIDSKSE
ncbi:MAG: amidohydrolase [Phototrophicales bacterium]|nr:MAG: amidohydrolase [Phototrophicales bacterium]